jgi:crossover junction endodeoxyribonuclease RuvC
MIVLGIDPGTAATGYGLVKMEGKDLQPIDWGCIKTQAGMPAGARLQIIYRELEKVIKKCKPDVAVIEELFFSQNAKTALSVGEARGVALLAATDYELEIAEYTPLQVKLSLTGYGRAQKRQIQEMVKNILKLDKLPRPDDAADGLAIALCYIYSHKLDKMGYRG